MGWRFRKSIRLFPGFRLNFSRSGVSTTLGPRGASMTVGPRGAHANLGIPGTGVSYRTSLTTQDAEVTSAASTSKTQDFLRLEGDGSYGFEVVGESNYQPSLEILCGGYCEEGHRVERSALLVPEPDNPYDANAVRVIVAGHTVAYLSRADALRHHAELKRLGHEGLICHCDAVIVGGWERQRSGQLDRGSFGIDLDIVVPLRGQVVTIDL